MSKLVNALANPVGLAVISLVSAIMTRMGAGLYVEAAAVFAIAGLTATIRRRLGVASPAFFDDYLRDLALYVAIGAFAVIVTFIATRLIGSPVDPAWPAAVVFLIGPTDGPRRRAWGVQV